MNQQKEISEAIAAGERALSSLREAQEHLRRASNWGFVDIMGGGFLSTLLKHNRMRDASCCLEQARCDLRRFCDELMDVRQDELNMDLDGFLNFADYFFDGFVADWLVQSKISQTREQVSGTIGRVETVLARLRG